MFPSCLCVSAMKILRGRGITSGGHSHVRQKGVSDTFYASLQSLLLFQPPKRRPVCHQLQQFLPYWCSSVRCFRNHLEPVCMQDGNWEEFMPSGAELWPIQHRDKSIIAAQFTLDQITIYILQWSTVMHSYSGSVLSLLYSSVLRPWSLGSHSQGKSVSDFLPREHGLKMYWGRYQALGWHLPWNVLIPVLFPVILTPLCCYLLRCFLF